MKRTDIEETLEDRIQVLGEMLYHGICPEYGPYEPSDVLDERLRDRLDELLAMAFDGKEWLVSIATAASVTSKRWTVRLDEEGLIAEVGAVMLTEMERLFSHPDFSEDGFFDLSEFGFYYWQEATARLALSRLLATGDASGLAQLKDQLALCTRRERKWHLHLINTTFLNPYIAPPFDSPLPSEARDLLIAIGRYRTKSKTKLEMCANAETWRDFYQALAAMTLRRWNYLRDMVEDLIQAEADRARLLKAKPLAETRCQEIG